MKAIHDPTGALAEGLVAIREQYKLPGDFPPSVIAAAQEAIRRPLDAHVDRTSIDFATLDPASSRDLDQAFFVEQSGSDLILRYAIADVGWFVRDGDPLDVEAWTRGTSIYLPGAKVPLYPTTLSEGAASLLPDVDRPAIVFSVRIDGAGKSSLDGVERALVRSRAKLGYATVERADLSPAFAELSRRIADAERARGAARIDPPQQEVEALDGGGYALGFRPMSPIEQDNAALSLAANLAIADALLAHHTGLFRVMAEPGKRAIKRLKHTAKALGIDWPQGTDVAALERSLDPNQPNQATFMLAARRAGNGRPMRPSMRGPCHGIRRFRQLMSTPPPRCADWVTAMSAWRHSRLPGASRSIRRLPRRFSGFRPRWTERTARARRSNPPLSSLLNRW